MSAEGYRSAYNEVATSEGIVPMQSKGTTANDFTRLPVLSVEQILIESQCLYCGNRIVSSVFEGLDEMEAEHRISCPKPSPKQ